MSAQKRDQPKPPRRPAPKPHQVPNRDKPVRGWTPRLPPSGSASPGWSRAKFGQAGLGRSGK